MTVTGRNAVKRDKNDVFLIGLTALPLILAIGIYVAYFGLMDWVPMVDSVKEAGLGQGFLNGYFAVPTLVVSLFNDTWVVYAPVNNGNGYAAGFLLGLVLAFVGARPRRNR
jgi:hypothetical protein